MPPPPSALPRVPPPPPPPPGVSANIDIPAQSLPDPPLNGSSQNLPVPPIVTKPHPPPDPAAASADATQDRDVTMVPADEKGDHQEKESAVNADLAPAQPPPLFAVQAADAPPLQPTAPMAQEHADGERTDMATEMQADDPSRSLDTRGQSTAPQPAEHVPADVSMDIDDDGAELREKEMVSPGAHQTVASSVQDQPDEPPAKAIEPTQPSTTNKDPIEGDTKAPSLSRADLDKMTVINPRLSNRLSMRI